MMITVRGITKTYDTEAGPFSALRGIDLDVDRGQLVGIVGRSGSGKSTLLNMLGGIDAPSSGTVQVAGTSVHTLGENALAAWRGRTVGLVFQFFHLLPTLTAIENVMLPMDFCRLIPARARRSRALDLLEQFGVAAQADKLPSSLSGGEQQRVAIARALANEPSVILADEPTGNLDSASAEGVMKVFRELADRGTAVIIATHDQDVMRLADRCVTIVDGVAA